MNFMKQLKIKKKQPMANDRNAGRKPINGVIVRLKIPKEKVAELKAFAKTLQFTNKQNEKLQ